jgi:hypothetical protein
MNEWLVWAKDVFIDDVRLYFAPFRGAIRGAIEEVKKEVNRPPRLTPWETPEQDSRDVAAGAKP